MNVKFQNLALVNEPHLPLWKEELERIVKNNQFILGPDVKYFENSFSQYIGAKYAIGVNNGTSALTIALRALKLKHPNIKFVACPAMTFAASIEAIYNSALIPVLVDITSSGGMDFDQLKKIRELQQIDAVIVVHLCGTAVEIPDLDIPVIEDACQSIGSEFKDGKMTGSRGIISAFSFYSGKNLGALGDGGAICTSDDDLNKYCKMLRNHGCETKYVHEYIGYTARLDNLQAMFLNTKLPFIDGENDCRRDAASLYYEQLLSSKVINFFEFQTKEPTKKNNFHLFVIKTPRRDELAKFLNDSGIETGLHYPISLNNSEANKGNFFCLKNGIINAEKWANQCLSLPIHPFISREEIIYVCDKIKEFFKDEIAKEPNKRMAILPLMEPDEYLTFAIDSVIDDVDYLLFSVNTKSWGDPNIKLTIENKQWIENFVKTNPKFRLMMGTWSREHAQHNAGIEYAATSGCKSVLCLATDLVYGEGEARKILAVLDLPDVDMVKGPWKNFWKKSPLYMISPPDIHVPILALKTYVRYSDICFAEGKAAILTEDDIKLFHFSYARDDDFIKKKIKMSAHASEVKPDWFENVWMKFKVGDINLSPFFPEQFAGVVEYSLELLPIKLREYFSKNKG